ncbi:MAG: type II toxin-antitoxin system HicB family antitoxin [Lachnospiraceae bacterium]|nr:type II toxin-antitoxin system HicB family antitoxin [Lachnospiraceae bacterium]
MKFTYPAVFKKREDGTWHGRFVDLDGLEVTGYSLDDAIRNAIIEEGDWIRLELSEDEPEMPLITDIEDIELEEGEIKREIAVNVRFYEGWDE